MFDSEFIQQVEAVADSFDLETADPQRMIDGILLLKQIVEKHRDYGTMMVTRRLLNSEMFDVRKDWLKEARKEWVTSLPSPREVGDRGLAKCGDYADPKDVPEGRRGYSYTSSCHHKAKYATNARRWVSAEPGPMRFYCGTHANEIANGIVQFPAGEEGAAIYRERIEDFDQRQAIARA